MAIGRERGLISWSDANARHRPWLSAHALLCDGRRERRRTASGRHGDCAKVSRRGRSKNPVRPRIIFPNQRWRFSPAMVPALILTYLPKRNKTGAKKGGGCKRMPPPPVSTSGSRADGRVSPRGWVDGSGRNRGGHGAVRTTTDKRGCGRRSNWVGGSVDHCLFSSQALCSSNQSLLEAPSLPICRGCARGRMSISISSMMTGYLCP